MPRPSIIGHRGACGYLPEHTIESYRRALELGADVVETDVVMTRDRQLICRHDCELSVTTDVADRAEFASRRTTRMIEGVEVQGWFVHDFTLDEIRLLRSRERFPFRDHAFDDRFGVVSLRELLDFARGQRTRAGSWPGVIIEIKHANYFNSIGLPMDEAVASALSGCLAPVRTGEGWSEGPDCELRNSPNGPSPQPSPPSTGEREPEDESAIRVGAELRTDSREHENTVRSADPTNSTLGIWVESFEIDILRRLRGMIERPIIQLLDGPNMRPADVSAAGGSLTYAEMTTQAGLAEIATYASGIGAWKRLIVPALPNGDKTATLGPPTSLISDAHAKELAVHAWTFRSEPQFLASDYENDPAREYQQFAALGLDGFITDFPDVAIAALTESGGNEMTESRNRKR